MQKFKATGDSRYIYTNEPDKTCLQHNIAYGHFKDLLRRRVSDKILRDWHLKLLVIQIMMDMNVDLHQSSKKCFDKRARDTSTQTGTGISEGCSMNFKGLSPENLKKFKCPYFIEIHLGF